MTTAELPVYDSAAPRRPILDESKNLWRNRDLIKLLVQRDLTVRYKRSVLGVWWTLLNPILTTIVFWVVFSAIFSRIGEGEVPYIVYLLSGILLISTFFAQGVLAAGASLVGSRGILTRVPVPPEVFSLTASLAAAVNFLIGLIPLLALELILGWGIPWTVILVPIPTLAMLGLATGVGMIIAAAAVHFFDVLDFSRVVIQLMVWMVPTFYPLVIVPESFQWVIKINPLYSYLVVFRGFVYGGTFAPTWNFVMMGGSAIAFFLIGVYVFGRSWRSLVARL